MPFVVDDDVEAARIAGVDGVHVGQDDAACVEAREKLGPCLLYTSRLRARGERRRGRARGARLRRRARGSGISRLAPALLPVSYTHLDVYKRQSQDICAADFHAMLPTRFHGDVQNPARLPFSVTPSVICLLYTSPQRQTSFDVERAHRLVE